VSQNLRDPVVRKHSQLFRFRELLLMFDISICPDEVSTQDLRPLIKEDLAPIKNSFISESRKLLNYEVNKGHTVKIGSQHKIIKFGVVLIFNYGGHFVYNTCTF